MPFNKAISTPFVLQESAKSHTRDTNFETTICKSLLASTYLHIIFRHLYRKPKHNADLKLFNIAADLVVNQLIAPWPLPESGVTLKTFPDYDLRPNQTVEWYYDKLLNLKKAALRQNNSQSHNKNDGSGEGEADNASQSIEALKRMLDQTSHSDHSLWAASGGAAEANGQPMSQTLIDALEVDIERHVVRARNRIPINQWGSIPAEIQTEYLYLG